MTAAYFFLAIVLAPALIGLDLDPIAEHLFILYWGMVSFITPPEIFLASKMTPERIAEAKRLAQEWRPGDCEPEVSEPTAEN